MAEHLSLARAMKRKRSSDVASECTHTTECTDASHVVLDERAQQLADKRAQHAAERLQLEQQIQQLDEQRQHVAVQLEQLAGCEGGKDQLGVADLKQQLQSYQQQHQQATHRLADLEQQFEAAVAGILGITPEQQPQLLAAAVQQQQQLQEVQVQQLAVEQQLAGSDFAVTASRPHKSKQARLDKMSSVWDWLRDSADGQGSAEQPEPAAGGQAQGGPSSQQQEQQQQQQNGQPPAEEVRSPSRHELSHSSSQQAQQQQQQQSSSPQQPQQQTQEHVVHAAA